jgi:hypothetical protein
MWQNLLIFLKTDLSHARFEDLLPVFLNIQGFWGVTLCFWVSSSWCFEDCSAFIFMVKCIKEVSVQEGRVYYTLKRPCGWRANVGGNVKHLAGHLCSNWNEG